MNCKKCGAQLTNEDQFCKSCGAAVNNISASNLGPIESGQAQQPVNNVVNGQPTNNSISEQPINNNMGSQPVFNQPTSQSEYNPVPNQPPLANSYNSQPAYNQIPQKNNNNIKFIIIGIIVVVAIVATIVIVGMLNNKDGSPENDGSSSRGSQVISNQSYKVNFKGFTFNIPDDLIYKEENEFLFIGDELGTWRTRLELEEGSFSQLQANKNQLQTIFQQGGRIATMAVEKTLGGVNFITLELSASGQKFVIALAKANPMYYIAVTAWTQDNDYDYSLLEKVAPIISSASYSGETNSIKPNFELDLSSITDLAK